MNVKNFVLSYYKNSAENFHIQKLDKVTEAQNPHTHEYFQIYFISKGSLKHHVENKSAHLNQGDMFIIPPGVTHYITPSQNTVFYSFSFMEDLFSEQHTNNKLARNFLRLLQTNEDIYVKPKILMNAEEIFYIENLMAHILKEFTTKPIAYYDTVQAYAQLLVTILAREYFTKDEHNITEHFNDNRQFVLHCVEYIENNYNQNISINTLAKLCHCSESGFFKLFRKSTGVTPITYKHNIMIQHALDLLSHTTLSIEEVSSKTGFSSSNYFRTVFLKLTGTTPKELRKRQ